MRCEFITFATSLQEGVLKYRHRCRICKIETGWTKSIAENVICICSFTSDENELQCIHRKEVIGTHQCEQCGEKGKTVNIHHCDLLNTPCILRWWTNNGKKRKDSNETQCLTCYSREDSNGTKPFSEFMESSK